MGWFAPRVVKPLPAETRSALIYDGFLPQEIADYIRRSEYHYWVEIKIDNTRDPETRQPTPEWRAFCDAFNEWSNSPDGLILYDCTRDSDWGGSSKEHYKSRMYCMYEQFWGFYSAAEHARFCAHFGDRVNPKPFRTAF